MFCSYFAELIHLNSVAYELDGEYIRCKNFSPYMNFEPMAALAGDNDRCDYVFNILCGIREDLARDYLKLILFDSIMNNIDRHNENYGLLRDPESGTILSLAPNFDNNLALIATTERLNSPSKDGFIKVFTDFIKKNAVARSMLHEISIPDIDLDDLRLIALQIPIRINNLEEIVSSVLLRYNYLKKLL